MTKQAVLLVATLGAIMLLACSRVEPGHSGHEQGSVAPIVSDQRSVEAVLDQYLRAFHTRDQESVSQVYAHNDDLVVFGSNPADRRFGWNATREYIQKYFAEVTAIDITVKERKIKIHQSGETAWFAQVLDWRETAGKEIATIDGLRISGVLEKREGRWQIVQLHASGPSPVLQQAPDSPPRNY